LGFKKAVVPQASLRQEAEELKSLPLKLHGVRWLADALKGIEL